MPDHTNEFGDEYPDAVTMDGVRMPLFLETRVSRNYESDDGMIGIQVSRFQDGSASLTAPELVRDWASWSDDLKTDFCSSSHALYEQGEFPEMLRFIMKHGRPEHWAGIALSVATRLPRDEAFATLVRALDETDLGSQSSNISHAIAHTRHPDSEAVLRRHLADLWQHSRLWDTGDNPNWIAHALTWCIANVIELGAPPAEFAEQVRQLVDRVSAHDHETVRRVLSPHYSWLQGFDHEDGG
jgi:hypothetical protein